MSKLTGGDKVSEQICNNKFNMDCKCLGYFYHREASYELKTLTKVVNSKHVGFIKVPKN